MLFFYNDSYFSSLKFTKITLERGIFYATQPNDPEYIIMLFFIYLDSFKVEILEVLDCNIIFTGRSQFGELGSKTF